MTPSINHLVKDTLMQTTPTLQSATFFDLADLTISDPALATKLIEAVDQLPVHGDEWQHEPITVFYTITSYVAHECSEGIISPALLAAITSTIDPTVLARELARHWDDGDRDYIWLDNDIIVHAPLTF